MPENKTKPTTEDVYAFIEQFADTDQKRADSHALIQLMKEASGFEPYMWGASIIGFGSYHYKYASGHEGDAPMLGFSPRKAAISLYVFTGLDEHLPQLEKLGKFKMGKACIYVKKLSDIDTAVLKNVMESTLDFLENTYEVSDKKIC
jgi:hypothetical protein